MTNGSLPWLDQASRVITQVGFPIVVAALLLWWVLFRFQAQVEAITGRLEHNAQVAAELVGATKASTGLQQQWANEAITELRKQTTELHDQTDALRLLTDRGIRERKERTP